MADAMEGLTPEEKAAFEEAEQKTRERYELARKVVDLAEGLVVSDSHFLAPAIGQLKSDISPALMIEPFATDGQTLYIEPTRVLATFAKTRKPPIHDIVHVLMHCILMHPFVDDRVERFPWDLASDIIAESLAAEICGAREGDRGEAISVVLEHLKKDLHGPLSTDRLYRALRRGYYHDLMSAWGSIFHVDNHDLWYAVPASSPENGGQQKEGSSSHAPTEYEERHAPNQGSGEEREGSARKTQQQSRQASGNGGEAENEALVRQAGGLGEREREHERDKWQQVAKSINVDLHTLSRERGEQLGDLTNELEIRTHRPQDFREFLRKFAVMQESLHTSDDEFDYVFYTYGLALYGNVPLIEPLEYRDEKRIREFAIVLDTSGSVAGDTIQRFVDTAFDVLHADSTFTERTNIHIIEADAGVESDTKISTPEDLAKWSDHVTVKGFGGTDFRPAFDYIDRLIREGEFRHLDGMVYFTDGFGTYPKRKPPYKCAFIFYDESYRKESVPPWAIQLVLPPEELERESDESESYRAQKAEKRG